MSTAVEAFREIFNGPVPKTELDYRRTIILAVLIGREIEAELSKSVEVPADYNPHYDEAALVRFVEAGRIAWAGIPDGDAWLRDLRGA